MAELERKAGYGLVIALSITAMIGTGVFFGPAIAASHAGNASIISWIILALIGVYVGLCFAELSSMFPEVGGVYQFVKKAYGRFTSFLVGWVTWLVGSITSSLLIVAAIDSLLPAAQPSTKILLAIGILLVLSYVAIKGVEASTALLLFFATVTLAVILTLTVGAATQLEPSNYAPFLAPGQAPITIMIALFFILESFIGWESATFMSGETRDPQRTIPRSIIITSVLVGAIIIAYPTLILGFIPWETLSSLQTPLATTAYLLFNETGAKAVAIAVFLALIGSAAGGIVATPRLILALAKDKLFITQLAAIHPRHKTPHKAIIFQTAVSVIVVLTALGDYESLLSLLVPLVIIMYITVILAVPILRRRMRGAKRYVKAPFGSWLPIIIAFFYAGIIAVWVALVPGSSYLLRKIASFILFGIPIYLLLDFYYNPDILTRTMNRFARVSRFFERFILPRRVRRDILGVFTGIKGKTVLEFGSGAGAFTLPLAAAVGKKGKVYSIDLSRNNLAILQRRLEKHGHGHVITIHDEHLISRVHPDVPRVDMVFSVGSISYVQDIRKVLREMHSLLPENGQICLVEYVNYFWGIIPNQPWLDDLEALERTCREVGFSIRIRKRRGLFWQYLFIYGIKSEYDVPVI